VIFSTFVKVFSEKLLKENKRLNELVDQQKGLVVVDQDVPDGQAIENKMNVSCKTIFMAGLV
jgi:hypothetical protein